MMRKKLTMCAAFVINWSIWSTLAPLAATFVDNVYRRRKKKEQNYWISKTKGHVILTHPRRTLESPKPEDCQPLQNPGKNIPAPRVEIWNYKIWIANWQYQNDRKITLASDFTTLYFRKIQICRGLTIRKNTKFLKNENNEKWNFDKIKKISLKFKIGETLKIWKNWKINTLNFPTYIYIYIYFLDFKIQTIENNKIENLPWFSSYNNSLANSIFLGFHAFWKSPLERCNAIKYT